MAGDASLELRDDAVGAAGVLWLCPVAASLTQVKGNIHAALLRRWWADLRARRRKFGARRVEVDIGAMRCLADVTRRPDAESALRVILRDDQGKAQGGKDVNKIPRTAYLHVT